MGKVLSEKEYKILKAFEKGNYIINKEVEDILLRYALTGEVSFGFVSGTAELTERGKELLRLDELIGKKFNNRK